MVSYCDILLYKILPQKDSFILTQMKSFKFANIKNSSKPIKSLGIAQGYKIWIIHPLKIEIWVISSEG